MAIAARGLGGVLLGAVWAAILPLGLMAADEPVKPPAAEIPEQQPAAEKSAPTAPDVAALADLVKRLDESLAKEIPAAGRTPAPPAGDATFLRRIYLDLVGVIPSPKEIAAFAADTAPDKRAKVVEKLLADPRYGRNWGRYWRDVIMYRKTEDRALLASEKLATYLAEHLNQNVSWDKIATELITASGDVTEEGATGLIFAQGGKPEETVAEVSRIFLGIQIQCAQCHDHHTDRWKREQFHELAAFFPRISVRQQMKDERRTFVVTVTDAQRGFGGNFMGNRFRGTPEHYMPDLSNPQARGKLMTPTFFVTGQKLPLGTKDADRRGTLAKWISSADDPWFAKAFVNRMWTDLVGQGFYPSVDDIGPDREAIAPETLEKLAAAFVASGYDVKAIVATIAMTAAYQRESRARPEHGETPFLANVNQRLRADQVYDNLVASLELGSGGFFGGRPFAGGGAAQRFRRSPRSIFAATFGFDPSTPRDEVAGSIPQALALMNSSLITGAVSANRSAVVGRLLAAHKDNDEVTRQLYLRVLAREPTGSELVTVQNYVRLVGDRSFAFEDVAWALVNSSEFLHRN